MTDPFHVRAETRPAEAPLGALRPCPGCDACLIAEHEKRCHRCQSFRDRRRTVTDADWSAAVRDGFILEPTRRTSAERQA